MPDAALILFGGAGHFAYLDDLPRFLHIASYFFAQEGATTDTARAEGDV
jgi:hypothetical protein